MATRTKRKERDEHSGDTEEARDCIAHVDVAHVDAAYDAVDGYAIARVEKKRQRDAGEMLDGIQYGEVSTSAFAEALAWMNPNPGESFIDLGSGTGKAVLTAAAAYSLASATGVQILRPLHDAAVSALGRCVAQCFAQRRKTLRNNLKGYLDDAALEQLGIDPGARAETLTMEAFIAVTQVMPPSPASD